MTKNLLKKVFNSSTSNTSRRRSQQGANEIDNNNQTHLSDDDLATSSHSLLSYIMASSSSSPSSASSSPSPCPPGQSPSTPRGSKDGPYKGLPTFGDGLTPLVPRDRRPRDCVEPGEPFGKEGVFLEKIVRVVSMAAQYRSQRGFKIAVRFAEDPDKDYFVAHDDLRYFTNGEKAARAYIDSLCNSTDPELVTIYLGLIQHTSKARAFVCRIKEAKIK